MWITAPAPVRKFTAPWKSLFWVLRSMSWVMPATVEFWVNVAAPVTVRTPVSLRAPLVDTSSVPPTMDVPSTVARLFTRLTLPVAPVVLKDTAPVKALVAVLRVMAWFAVLVVKLDVPVTAKAPLWPIVPVVSVTLKAPPMVEAPNTVPPLFNRLTSPPAPVVLNDTAPPKALVEVLRVIALAPAVKLEVPVTVKAPVSLITPLLVTPKVPPMVDAPSTVAWLFVRLTLPVPVVKLTAPVNRLALPRVMPFAPAVVKLDVPPTVRAPVWLIAPVVSDTVRLPPIVDAASCVPPLFSRLTLPVAPGVLNVIAPPRTFVWVPRSMVWFAVLVVKLEVVPTVNTPASLIEPVVSVTLKLPPMVEAPKSVPPLFFRLTLPVAPLCVRNDTIPPNTLVELFRVIAWPAPVVLKLDPPVTFRTPVWMMAPLLLTVRLPPMTEAPNTVARLLVRLALPVPVVKLTAPVNALPAVVRVTLPLPPELVLPNVEVPFTVNAPVWLIVPSAVSAMLPPTVTAPRLTEVFT